jgi:hypothetical protein
MDSLELQIEVSISNISNYQGGGNVRLSERVMIPAADFGTLSQIMAGFHEMLTAVKEAKEAEGGSA